MKKIVSLDNLGIIVELPHLPSEVWILILANLDFMSLLTVSGVNRRLMDIANDHLLWKNLCFKHSISLENEESLSLFTECLLLSDSSSVWKKLLIRHFKNEHRNMILSKLFWASHEANSISRLLNTTGSPRPRLITYGGSYSPCPQCEREKELFGRMDITTDHGNYNFYNTRFTINFKIHSIKNLV